MRKKLVFTPGNPDPAMLKKIDHKLPIPEICNLCGGKVSVRHFPLWGEGKYPWAYQCESCYARASMHRDTNLPMGTLANRQTRRSRSRCKQSFIAVVESGLMTKKAAYRSLSVIMGIEFSRCHFSMFNSSQCAHAKAICDKWLSDAGKKRSNSPNLWSGEVAGE